MKKIESTAAVAVLQHEPTDREFVDSCGCGWQQILRILEENALNSRHSFSSTKQQFYPQMSEAHEVKRINL